MKRRICYFIVLVIVAAFAMASCGDKETAEERAAREAMESAVAQILEQGGSAAQETPTTTPNLEPPVFAHLNLPIIVQDMVFYDSGGSSSLLVRSDGVLQRGRLRRGAWEWEDIADNVRSVTSDGSTTMFVTNNNEMWGFGSNRNGVLGDGTGVDRNEPIFILSDVAAIYRIHSRVAFALRTDGTLWQWGDGTFEPVQIADDVARLIALDSSRGVYIHAISGGVYKIERDGAKSRLFDEPVYYVSGKVFEGSFIFINSERTLARWTQGWPEASFDEIAVNVEKASQLDRDNILFITSDGVLWGIGDNRNGELGDSTKVPRPEPVQIADNVVYVRAYAFLKQDGTFWTWNANDPTPKQTLEGVLMEADGNLHLQDGSMVIFHYGTEYKIDNVRVPHPLSFTN